MMGSNSDNPAIGRDASPTPVLDREQIDGLIAAAGVSGAREILDAFWRSTNTLLQNLKTQLASGDLTEASRTAHALKGSALNVGAMRLSCAARGIEDACKGGDDAGAQKRLNSAESQCSETVSAFEALFESAA